MGPEDVRYGHVAPSPPTIDLARLLVGSEGTLALFTEATLRTVPLPEGRSLVLFSFASLEAALRAARKILESGPSACDLLDRRLLGLIRANEASQLAQLVPAAAEAVLLVEFEGGQRAAVPQCRPRSGLGDERSSMRSCCMPWPRWTRLDFARIRAAARRGACPVFMATKTGAQPLPFVEDIGVPLDSMPEFMRRAQDLLQEQETTASFLIHACTGQIHTRPFLDLQRSEDVSKLIAMAENFHALALELGGTVSTQHGTGLARTPWVARQAGPLYPLMRQLKAIFDPKNIFNPGKIVDPEPSLASWPLRTPTPPSMQSLTVLGEVAEAPASRRKLTASPTLHCTGSRTSRGWRAIHCNGCGQCRSEVPALRMCPMFRATHAEAATPRAKANLVRDLLQQAESGAGAGLRSRCGPWPICASTARCAPWSVPPMSIFPS